jgi:hypothetical protein
MGIEITEKGSTGGQNNRRGGGTEFVIDHFLVDKRTSANRMESSRTNAIVKNLPDSQLHAAN